MTPSEREHIFCLLEYLRNRKQWFFKSAMQLAETLAGVLLHGISSAPISEAKESKRQNSTRCNDLHSPICSTLCEIDWLILLTIRMLGSEFFNPIATIVEYTT
jgi:hypothetical protein